MEKKKIGIAQLTRGRSFESVAMEKGKSNNEKDAINLAAATTEKRKRPRLAAVVFVLSLYGICSSTFSLEFFDKIHFFFFFFFFFNFF